MAFEDWLGRSVTLTIRRFNASGAFLGDPAAPSGPTLLLIGSEIPEGAQVGHELRVFVYLDSEGRPIATRRVPRVELDQVAFLTVTALSDFGAFVDWGLAKDLLVPFAEQTIELRVGMSHPIGLYVDDTGRLAGTMRVSEWLDATAPPYERGQWVHGEAWRNDPDIGLFVIVERAFSGLVPADEPHRLSRGASARFRVTHVHSDGKLELSLRAHAHEELGRDAEHVLSVLTGRAAPRVGDASTPDEIRTLFGLSKKAFKRAGGRLLKDGAIEIDDDGYWTVRRR
jgi:predicted RNA-binding protein (virulence factor B family)